MGDRAVVIFHDDGGEMSPCAYLHSHGSRVEALLRSALPRMRTGDASYSCARFIGECAMNIGGNLGLGVFNSPETIAEVREKEFSHGDAGVFLVSVVSWSVIALNGYGFGDGRMFLQLDKHMAGT